MGEVVLRRVSFDEWMERVNMWIAKRAMGMDADCLPDAPYRDWYESKISPQAAAKRAISHAKTF